MTSHACCLRLSVGCCYDYEKPVEPNELSAAVLREPAILLMENSVAYSAELYPGSSILKKICSKKRGVMGMLVYSYYGQVCALAAIWTGC